MPIGFMSKSALKGIAVHRGPMYMRDFKALPCLQEVYGEHDDKGIVGWLVDSECPEFVDLEKRKQLKQGGRPLKLRQKVPTERPQTPAEKEAMEMKRIIARCAEGNCDGVGDKLAVFLDSIGVEAAADFARSLGIACGCPERAEWLNEYLKAYPRLSGALSGALSAAASAAKKAKESLVSVKNAIREAFTGSKSE